MAFTGQNGDAFAKLNAHVGSLQGYLDATNAAIAAYQNLNYPEVKALLAESHLTITTLLMKWQAAQSVAGDFNANE